MFKKTLIFMSLLSVFTLSSCKNDTDIINSTTPAINYTNETTKTSTTEETIEKIYASVVSIDNYVDDSLYGSGSGIIVAKDENLNLSYVLTCYHVIDEGTSFIVNLASGTSKEAILVGGDVASDLALLAIEDTNYNYATLGNSNNLKLGSSVIVIGNPLGTLPGSVSTGIISYINRDVLSEDYRTMTLIQTDTAINSGNSGGGMFDMNGNLVGVVNAKYAKEGIEGLGFAIPVNDAKEVIESVLSTAVYDNDSKTFSTKGYLNGAYELGFTIGDFQSLPFFNTYVRISDISSNKTTTGYGQFETNDIIESVIVKTSDNTYEITNFSSSASLYQQLYSLDITVGDTLVFTIYRNNVKEEIRVTVTQFIPE